MTWLYLSLLSALAHAIANIARRTHGSLADPAELSWWCLLLSTPVGIALVLFDPTSLYQSLDFILPATASGILCTVASILCFKAYKYADASAIAPISNLLPLGIVVSSLIILQVAPSALGLLGVVLIVAGVFYSSVHGRHSLLHPFKQLTKNKGSRAMLLVISIWSVTTVFDKIALGNMSATFLTLYIQLSMLTLTSLYLLARPQRRRLKRGERVFRRWGWHLITISFFTTVAVTLQGFAIQSVENPSYVLAVKRLDTLIVIVLAYFLLHERHIMKRFIGSLIAVAGVAVLMFAS